MKKVVLQAFILGMVASLCRAEYTGSSGGTSAGLSSSYNSGYVGEYAGQISAGQALSGLHGYGKQQIAPEHGNQYDSGAGTRYTSGVDYAQQQDNGQKFAGAHYDGISENLDISKFPLDVEAQHYTGEGTADTGLGDDGSRQDPHPSRINEYQGEEGDSDQGTQNLPYTPYDNPEKQSDYKNYDERLRIVPYSGYEEPKQQPSYNGYQHHQEHYNQAYEAPKTQSYEVVKAQEHSYNSYESGKGSGPSYNPYESPKPPSLSYNSYESQKASPSYGSYNSQKGQNPSYDSYESAKAPSYGSYETQNSPGSYGGSNESPKAPQQTYIAYEGPKPASSPYNHYESPKVPSHNSYESPKPTYSFSYESPKAPTSSKDYNSGGHVKYQSYPSPSPSTLPSPSPSPETESKGLEIIEKIKTADLKDFHAPLQKDIMTIDHGKGSYSYSSLYRS